MNYDHIRFAYETPVRPGYKDALLTAAAMAVTRSRRWHPGDDTETFAFRVIDVSYAVVVDPDGDVYGSETQLEIVAFPVVKQTDTGFRICRSCRTHGGRGETRWIALNWNKQWASLTPEDAVRHFIARKKRQAAIYDARSNKAKNMQREAERLLGGDTWPI